MTLVAIRMPDGVPGLLRVECVNHEEAREAVRETFPTAVVILALVTDL